MSQRRSTGAALDRLALADAIERAKGPSRLLDCHAWLIVGPLLGQPFSVRGDAPILPAEIVQGRWFGSALDKYPEDIEGVARSWRVPRFTACTDAARMLLANIGYVLWRPLGKRPSVCTEDEGGWSDHSSGANEAMALSAAGLRAGGPIVYDPTKWNLEEGREP